MKEPGENSQNNFEGEKTNTLQYMSARPHAYLNYDYESEDDLEEKTFQKEKKKTFQEVQERSNNQTKKTTDGRSRKNTARSVLSKAKNNPFDQIKAIAGLDDPEQKEKALERLKKFDFDLLDEDNQSSSQSGNSNESNVHKIGSSSIYQPHNHVNSKIHNQSIGKKPSFD